MKARFRCARRKVEVKEIPGKPGSYNAIAYLRPWLQMEELTTSLRMVARIPPRWPERADHLAERPPRRGGTGRRHGLTTATIAGPCRDGARRAPPAARPSRSLRDAVLAGRFFGDRHADAAAELAAFLHGGRTARGDGSVVRRRAAAGLLGDRRRCGRRSIATSPRSMRHAGRAARCRPAPPAPAQARGTLARRRLADRRHRTRPTASSCEILHRRLARALPRPRARHRVRPEPAVPARSTRTSSACPAASRMGCWSSTTTSAIAPAPGSRPTT